MQAGDHTGPDRMSSSSTRIMCGAEEVLRLGQHLHPLGAAPQGLRPHFLFSRLG